MQEQFKRSALLFGVENIEKLSTKRVAVFGVGGVGSFAVEALARGGIGSFLLVDNDTVDISNINRQLPATFDTVGEYKTKVLETRIKSINPQSVVETREEFCLAENIDEILKGDYDYILDAVDTVSAKLAIVEYGKTNGVPVLSCMGAGNKLDPTKFVVTDIYKTETCPLARVMRRELKKRGIESLKVVYSTEEAKTPRYAEQYGEIDAIKNDQRMPPGSVSFVPPVAGMIAAGEILKDLTGIYSQFRVNQ